MKKRIGLLTITLMLLVLSGCACKHEWTAPDCLNPQVCAKCGEEGTEQALGHDWSEATCQTPKTCSRCGETEGQTLEHDWAEATCQTPETCRLCGETQGEVLEHSFGDWSIEGTQMTHTCEACGETESTEIDRELFFKDNIVGAWDLYYISQGGHAFFPDENNFSYWNIMEGGSVDSNISGESQHGSWKFKEYEKSDEGGTYVFSVELGDTQGDLFYVNDGVDIGILMLLGQGQYLVFEKNDEKAAALVGVYAGSSNGEMYTVTLEADRSFTGNLDGEIQGTWGLSDQSFSWGRSLMIHFMYQKDGTQKTLSADIWLGGEEALGEDFDTVQYLRDTDWSFSVYPPDGEYVNLQPMDEESIQEMRKTLEDGGKQIAGTWNSVRKNIYPDDGDDYVLCTDYAITFSEDGTFTSNVEVLPSGTWAVGSVTGDYTEYTLTVEGVNHVSARVEGELLDIFYNVNSGDNRGSFDFTRSTSELAEKAVGTWTSFEVQSEDNQGQWIVEESTEYSITLAEDNTLTGNLDGEVAGTWVVVSESPERGIEIRIFLNDSIAQHTYISPNGTLSLGREMDGKYKSYDMRKSS